ncbi:MAG: T9SS type A sorting domain-containing protein [Bacteroidales bacterium]
MKRLHFIFSLLILSCMGAFAQTTDRIEQYGITWYFEGFHTYGQFANGDYWVKGPVIIKQITPDFDGMKNGWEVNPKSGNFQGLDGNANGWMDTLVPDLPYLAQPGESIVKAIGMGAPTRPDVKTAAVLTVLGEIPPDSGATVFRPPYSGTAKPLYRSNYLNMEVFPSLDLESVTVSLNQVKLNFQRPFIDYQRGWTGREIHPLENMPDYGADISVQLSNALLSLCLKGEDSLKKDAAIGVVQYGIDTYHLGLQGMVWDADGGIGWGRKLAVTAAAVLLDNHNMKDFLYNVDEHVFAPDHAAYFSQKADNGKGKVLYGDCQIGERAYWEVVLSHVGNKHQRDPYGYVDGGYAPATYYQLCCSSQPMKQIALVLHILPEFKATWSDTDVVDYAKRWVDEGAWALPDPCAPMDGVWRGTGPKNGTVCTQAMESPIDGDTCILSMDNYGITFGPDLLNPGECILDTDSSDGIGRFPATHGILPDGGGRSSALANLMWNVYRDSIFTVLEDTKTPTVKVTSPNGGEKWGSGETKTITWTSSDNVGVESRSIYLSTENSENWTLLDSSTHTSSLYEWTIPKIVHNQCKIRVVVYDAAGNSAIDQTDGFFNIIDIPSFISIVGVIEYPEITIYPNPTINKLFIKSNTNIKNDLIISIYDNTGRVLYSEKLDELSTSSIHEIDVSGFTHGIYILQINNFKLITIKIIIMQ